MTTDALSAPLTSMRGVGEKVAEKLARLGLHQLSDLLFHLPAHYQDKTCLTPIQSLDVDQTALVEGQIIDVQLRRFGHKMLALALEDDSGVMTIRLFNFYPNQVRSLRSGVRLRCYGQARQGYQGGLEMIHPQWEIIRKPVPLEATLTPIYPLTEGLGQGLITRLCQQAIEQMGQLEFELLPPSLLKQVGLPPLNESIRFVHQPPAGADTRLLMRGEHPCQQRLAVDELLAHRLSLRLLRQKIQSRSSGALPADSALRTRFLSQLPFTLTSAQQRVIKEISADLSQTRPALRLIQGDVGSGKTVVAAAALAQCIASGYQAAMIAPTEILAEQHLHSLAKWFEPLGVKLVWLAGKVRGKARTAALESICGDGQLMIGTHALFQEAVQFRNLGLIVIDEQHRFGVDQRLALRDKGLSQQLAPHQLIMTATPIPRTLAMTAYADLDVSVIDELPPNRQHVQTIAISNRRRADIIARIRHACAQGRQAYWVCTLIETSDKLEAEAASEIAEQLLNELPELNVALVHGRLPSDEKASLMSDFKAGHTDLLVATTVIEVGVDVPNASLMVIENAERLGLSQLHQLRGRVGRGAQQSTCVLLYRSPLSRTARERLQLMRQTNDGFEIARKDLELRGPGEVLGTRQTGDMGLKVANLERDHHLLGLVSSLSETLLTEHPGVALALIQRWVGQAAAYAEV